MALISTRNVMLWLVIVAANIAAQADQTNLPAAVPNGLANRPPGFEVLSNRWRTLLGISNFGGAPAPNSIPPPFQHPPAPPPPAWLNTNLDTHFTVMETSNIVPHDAMEAWLLKTIETNKFDLQKTNLDSHSRWMLEQHLRLLQGQWSDHEAQVESNKAFAEAIRSNPRGALTNMPDPITQALSLSVARTKSELADPTIDPYRRQAHETVLGTFKQQLADHETNAQLWADVHSARASGNQEEISNAEHMLADYLAAKIGKPKGMSLDAVMEEYKKRSGDYHWYDSRPIIRTTLLVVFLVPPTVMIFFALKKRFSKPG